MKNPIYKKWFLATAVLVVLLANGPGLAATNAHMVAIAANCSPPAISADQVVVLTGTVLVTLTDQVDNAVTNEVTIRVVTGFEVTLDANTTAPANNLRTENGVAIVTSTNAAQAGVPPIAAENSANKAHRIAPAREVAVLLIKPHAAQTTLANATG